MLFDRRLEDIRRLAVDRLQLVLAADPPHPRRGNPQLPGPLVGVALVPRPLRDLPIRRRNPEMLAQLRAMAREGRDGLLAGRIQHPAGELARTGQVEQDARRRAILTQVREPERAAHVAGMTADRVLIVDHRDVHPTATETAHDPESLVVASDDDRAWPRRRPIGHAKARHQLPRSNSTRASSSAGPTTRHASPSNSIDDAARRRHQALTSLGSAVHAVSSAEKRSRNRE